MSSILLQLCAFDPSQSRDQERTAWIDRSSAFAPQMQRTRIPWDGLSRGGVKIFGGGEEYMLYRSDFKKPKLHLKKISGLSQ
jgi:hypothetical protein